MGFRNSPITHGKRGFFFTSLLALVTVFIAPDRSGTAAHAGESGRYAAQSDSLYNALHPRLLFDAVDLPALYDKVRDGGYDDDAYLFIRLMADYIYPGDDEIGILGDDHGLSSVPMLGVATFLENPEDESARNIGRNVTMYLATQYEVDHDDYYSALRLRSLALGYDMFFKNADESDRQTVRAEIESYLDMMLSNLTYEVRLYRPYLSNRSAMVAAAVGLAAIVLADETDPQRVSGALAYTDEAVDAWTRFLLDSEGAYNEGVLYAAWSMRHLVYYFVARERYDGRSYATGKIRNIDRWLAYELLPEGNGKSNNINDSSYFDDPLPRHHTFFDWAQWKWQSGLSAYMYEHVAGQYGWDWGPKADKTATALWNTNVAPVQPGSLLPTSFVWDHRGLYYYRTGWPAGGSSDDVVFSFYSGRFQGGHAQEDQNQFTLYAYGGKFAIDHGGGHPGRQSESHNIVLIDGNGQHNAGGSIGTDGDISRYVLGGFADFVQGDATAAYTTYSPLNNKGYPLYTCDWSWGYSGSNPVLFAKRNVLTIHSEDGVPPYFLVFDDIDKDGLSHDYRWQIHTADVNTVDTSSAETWIVAPPGRMIIHALNPPRESMTATVTAYDNQSEEPDSKLLAFEVNAVNPRFVFLMLPGDPATTVPTVERVEYPWGLLATIAWDTIVDVVILNFSGGQANANVVGLPTGPPPGPPAVGQLDSTGTASIQTDAHISLLRFSRSMLTRYLTTDTQSLTVDGVPLVSIADGPACVALSREVININRYDADFTFYAPGVSEIRYRSQQIHFAEDQGFLTPDPLVGVESPVAAPAAIRATAYPNPFNPSTAVVFEIAAGTHVSAAVYDPLGRLVRRLTDGVYPAGRHALRWDGTDAGGNRVATGVYFVKLETPSSSTTVKLTVLK